MTQIKQKFYPLTVEELIELSTKLTDTELKIYLYLMAANPFGDRAYEIDTAIIAEHMGVTRRTVQRVVKKLESLDLIEVEVSKFKYKKRQQDRQSDSRIAKATAGSPKRQQDRSSDSRIAKATAGSLKRQQDRQRSSEPLPEGNPSPSKTINTYSDYLDSLSESERESFLEFAKKKATQLPKPPELPLKWIEKNFEDLRSLYEKQNGIVRCSHSWSEDRQQEWLDKIRSLGFAAFIYEEGKLNLERKNFYEWANSKNLIWGAES